MKIAVVGSGGVGGYYGGLLALRGHDVRFLARGPHLRAMQRRGLQVKSVFGDFQVNPARATDRASEVGPVDLLLFCTKADGTEDAARSAVPLIGASTTVLPLQNGVEAHDRIGAVLGPQHMLAGATWLSSAILEPGVISHVSQFRRVVMGELDGRKTSRLLAARAVFEGTGVAAEISEDILGVLWAKLIFIAAASGIGALTRLPMGAYRDVPETRTLIATLMRETVAVAESRGVQLEPNVVDSALAFMDKVAPTIKASMQLDVESGRPSELEALIGVICRQGRQHRVLTPVANFIYGALLPIDRRAREGARSAQAPS